MTTNKIPSFQKIHYVLRPRKQIERKIIIELLREATHKLNLDITSYAYLGMGSIYYYDFILFHKYLSISDMISLDNKTCVNRFNFNRPFDFIRFENLSTSDYLPFHPSDSRKNSIIWFDYDSNIIWYSYKFNTFSSSTDIINDIATVTNKSKEFDFFIITVGCPISKKFFEPITRRQKFIDTFKHLLSNKYQQTKNITEANYPYAIQNIILNAIKNNEVGKTCKFRKLFSFHYQDSTQMYTLGGIFHSKILTGRTFKNRFFTFNEDQISHIGTPLLTYKEKIHLDQKIKHLHDNIIGKSDEEIEELVNEDIGFELNCLDIKSYLEYYKYYPQYYEGII